MAEVQMENMVEDMPALINGFIEVCSTANEEEAVYHLKKSNYDLRKAVLSYMENPNIVSRTLRVQRTVKRYIAQNSRTVGSRRSKITKWLDMKMWGFCQHIRYLWRQISKLALIGVPKQIRGESDGEQFQQTYGFRMPWVSFEYDSLENCLRKAQETKRPLVIFELCKDLPNNALTVFTLETANLLVRHSLKQNHHYIVLGCKANDRNIRNFLTNSCGVADPDESTISTVTILRVNLCQEVVLLSTLRITDEVNALFVYNYFHGVISTVLEERGLENQALEEAINALKPQDEIASFGSPLSHISNEAQNRSELMEPQFDQRDFVAEKEFMQQQEENIKKQEEQLKKNEIDHQRDKQESAKQKAEQRKKRRQSFEIEPDQGAGVITISFRLPRGGRILRRFYSNHPIQQIFEFIELNEDVEFQNEMGRSFDLLTIGCGLSLLERRHEKLSDLFGQEAQETLLIKEI